MGKFENIIRNRYPKGNKWTTMLYRMWTCKWKQDNSKGFLENKNCYKIHCSDQNDDTVDVFSSHHHEIAKKASRVNYNTAGWKKFYEALKLVFNIERELYEAEIKDNLHNLKQIHKRMYQLIDQGDHQLNDIKFRSSSTNPLDNENESI